MLGINGLVLFILLTKKKLIVKIYVYSPTGYIPVNTLVVSKGGSLTITDLVAVYIAQGRKTP